jgi:hypothetical protein
MPTASFALLDKNVQSLCWSRYPRFPIFVLLSSDPNQNQALVESLCHSLGYNYSPFAWLEEHCEDIIEDYSAGVLRLLDKFNHDSHTAIPEEFCELLKCKYNDEEPSLDVPSTEL